MGTTDYVRTDEDLVWMRAPGMGVHIVECDHFVPFGYPRLVAATILEVLEFAS